MKRIVIILAPLAFIALIPAQEKKAEPPSELAAPLRKFDSNKDGKLTGDELKRARQEHNRGGREAEPNPRRWKEQLDRREKEFTQQRQRDFDLNSDGKLDDNERKELRAVWDKIAERFTTLRVTITDKYDRNDDGELNDQERNASRGESDRLRREVEEQFMQEWRKKREAKPAA